MTQYVIIGLIIAALIFLATKRKKKASKPQPSWIIGPIWNKQSLSVNMPASPAMAGAGWSIDFPVMVGNVNALQWVEGFPAVAMGQTITARFKIEGAGEFKVRDLEALPVASIGFMLQRKGDDLTGRGAGINYRWFSDMEFVLSEGEHEMSAVVDADNFSGIMGGRDPYALQDVLNNLGNISIIFGSGGGRAHGVYSTQPSTFTLNSLTIE